MDSTKVLDLLARVERLTHDRTDGDEQSALETDLLVCVDLLVHVCRLQDAQLHELRSPQKVARSWRLRFRWI